MRSLFFGIDDGELRVRRLHSLLYDRAHKIDYGERELAIWSFYVNAVRLVMPNEEACDGIVSGNPEWMLDYLILPLLASLRFRTLRVGAKEIIERVCVSLEKTPFGHEVWAYREAVQRADEGHDFSDRSLPSGISVRLIQGKPK